MNTFYQNSTWSKTKDHYVQHNYIATSIFHTLIKNHLTNENCHGEKQFSKHICTNVFVNL